MNFIFLFSNKELVAFNSRAREIFSNNLFPCITSTLPGVTLIPGIGILDFNIVNCKQQTNGHCTAGEYLYKGF